MLRGAVKLVYFHISEFWCVCVCVCSKILWSSTSAIIVILFCIYVRFLPEESELIKQTTIFILTNNTADDYLFNLQCGSSRIFKTSYRHISPSDSSRVVWVPPVRGSLRSRRGLASPTSLFPFPPGPPQCCWTSRTCGPSRSCCRPCTGRCAAWCRT
jgi:hypothetical protein